MIIIIIIIIVLIISDIVPYDEVNCAEDNNDGEKWEEHGYSESLKSVRHILHRKNGQAYLCSSIIMKYFS